MIHRVFQTDVQTLLHAVVTFVLGGLNQSVARTLRRHARPFFFSDPRAPNPSLRAAVVAKSGKAAGTNGKTAPTAAKESRPTRYTPAQWLYSVASIAVVQLTLNFTVAPFMLLSVSNSIKAWNGVGWYGAVMTVGTLLAFRFGGLGRVLDQQSGVAAAKKKKAAEEAAAAADGGAKTNKKDLRVLDGETVESAVQEGAQAVQETLEESKKDR